jgi:hypothetical protein
MPQVSAFCWQNAVKTATLAASSAEVALPVTNLVGDQGAASLGWQGLAGVLTGLLLTITPAARTTFRAFGVFRTNMTAAGTITVRAYTNPGAVLVNTWSATIVNGQAVVFAAADTPADIVTITFADGANPQNFINVPLVFAGPAWQPLTALGWASAMGRDAIADTVTTRGGQVYTNLRATSRRWELALDGIRQAESYQQVDLLDRASRVGGNVLVIPDVTSVEMPYVATFGQLVASADVTFPLGVISRRSWRARLTERL